jgi:8-oxo-dGTP pyrophosphatase MutT (NUDIX family)
MRSHELAAVTIPYVGSYHPHAVSDLKAAECFVDLLSRHGTRAFDRSLAEGHITASGFILNPARDHILLMHHAKLDRWLQPGGHSDGLTAVRQTAVREVLEETGLASVRMTSLEAFHLDIHEIPARKTEPAHLHYDVRFIFEAKMEATLKGNSESKALSWVPLATCSEAVEIARAAPDWLADRNL